MSTILAYTSPARGHLYPLTPILDELAARGHTIAVRTLASEVPLMTSRGFAATPLAERIEAIQLQDWQARNPRKALAASVRGFSERAPFDAADLTRAISQEQPDAVIVDINSWGALAAAERWGGPWAAFCPYPLALRSAQVPPFGPGLPPAQGALGRVRDALLRPAVTGTIERQLLPPLNDVRASLKLPALRHSDDLFTSPPLLLYLTAEPFEYPRRDWPDSIVQVGPCAWEPASEAPDWLTSIDGPLVLVTTSSEFQDDAKLVGVALAALAAEPVQVIATVPAGNPTDFKVPGNAHVQRFVPHSLVLDRAICAITHGGMGATQKALAHGVPVCAVPFGRDQLEVARRVAVAGAGTRLPVKRLTVDRLRAKVSEASTMTTGAERVARGFDAAGGPGAAADAVEQRLLTAHDRKTHPFVADTEPA
jgi:MGT family glycosyltransferase